MVNPVSFGAIQPIGERQAVAAKTAETQAKHGVAPQEPRVPVAQLTRLARELASAAPPVDHARIAQLSQAIAQGSYGFDPVHVADAVLRYLQPAKS